MVLKCEAASLFKYRLSITDKLLPYEDKYESSKKIMAGLA